MKRIFLSIAALSIFLSLPVYADQATKEQLIRFVNAIGLHDQIEEQITALENQGTQAAQQYAQQIKASVPGLPEEFTQYLENEYSTYMSNLSKLFDADHAANVYIELISAKLSAEEIAELTEFYESDLGKKFTRSNTEVMGKWAKAFMSDVESKMVASLESFANNLMAKASSYSQAQ